MLLYLFSLFPVAALLLRPLQGAYSSYNTHIRPLDYIVVLGSWHKSNTTTPLTSQLSTDSLIRTVEAVSIYYQNQGAMLLFSGGLAGDDPVSNAAMMAKLAKNLGVPDSSIMLEERPKNTREEALYLKEIVLGRSFVLVTSAVHMKRALALFAQQGMHPVPAPVNFQRLQEIPVSFHPSAKALRVSEDAMHEYFGLLWTFLSEEIEQK